MNHYSNGCFAYGHTELTPAPNSEYDGYNSRISNNFRGNAILLNHFAYFIMIKRKKFLPQLYDNKSDPRNTLFTPSFISPVCSYSDFQNSTLEWTFDPISGDK